jgi:hypothetical protein
MTETRAALDFLLRSAEGGPNAVDAALTEVEKWEAHRDAIEAELFSLREKAEQAKYAYEVLQGTFEVVGCR